jgi:hypothetical protein
VTIIAIPVTYPGLAPYSLEFRSEGPTLSVRRDWDDRGWHEVYDIRGTPHPSDPGQMIVEINADLRNGPPLYVIMSRTDWEGKVRGLKG